MRRQLLVKSLHVILVLALMSVCGSVITHGFIHSVPQPVYTDGVKERILGDGVKAQKFHLNHMVITEWGRVFVGAVNRIYELDSELNIITEVETGPVNDSKGCLPLASEESCHYARQVVDNHNQVLIHYKGLKEKILTCGSVYQGACEARNLKNISRAHHYYQSEHGSFADYAVAANNPGASTVAFIGPGPPDLLTEVLYVATTFSANGDDDIVKLLRDQVPAISTRSLGRDRFALNEVVDSFIGKLSGIFIKESVRYDYLIHYVTGFTSDQYSYFLTRQQESPESSKIVSKIIQVCQKDKFYYSYVDMPLVCKSETTGKEYNFIQSARVIRAPRNLQLSFGLRSAEDILVGVFTNDEGSEDSDSAVCMFTMQFIRKKLLENIKLCYSGEEVSGGGYLAKKLCTKLDQFFPDQDYLCNTELESIGNIVGVIPASVKPVMVYDRTWLTSIALTTTTVHAVAIIGTSDGFVKKVALETHERAREYDEVLVDLGSPINQDIYINRQYIYAMSKTKVAKLMLSNCEVRSSCSTCLDDGDPFCGWCVLDNRCTQRDRCQVSTSDRWLFGPPEQTCVAITDVSPSTVSVSERAADLYLTIYSLPDGSNYTCVFPELNETSPAQVWSYGVHCRAPDISRTNFQVKGSHTLTIALNSSETGKVFIAQNFTYFNCSSFQSCSQCTNNSWSCDWCIYDNRCVHKSAFCQQGIVLSKSFSGIPGGIQQTSGGSGMRGPLHCPRIDKDATGTLFVPEGVQKSVAVRGMNFPQPGALQYTCHVLVGSQLYRSNGTLSPTRAIICNLPSMQVPPYHTAGLYKANIYVYWGDTYMLEDAHGLQVTLYKCEVLAHGECGLCYSINYTQPELQCNWCDSSCKYMSHCHSFERQSCPAPQIQTVYPLSGAIGGGTLVNISGKDLGSKFEEVQNAVTIAGVRCAPLRDKYQPSQWIVCRLGPSLLPRYGIITVSLPNREPVDFHQQFKYQEPVISSIKPVIGPMAGGSMITIYGEHLDTGRIITASVGREECFILRSMVTSMIAFCETNSVPVAPEEPQPFRMYFDGFEARNSRVTFQYLPDPVVHRILPLESFISGGRRITITGENLFTVQQPRLFGVYTDLNGVLKSTEKEVCHPVSSSQMICPTPQLPKDALSSRSTRSRRSSQLEVELGFIMDNVDALRNLSGTGVNTKMQYYPDPVVYNFSEDNSIKRFKGEVLIFEGRGLNLAATESDVQVFIGQQICNVTNLSVSQIFCTPPASQPGNDYEHSNREDYPIVRVKIGNLEFRVGRLEYERVAEQSTSEYIMGIAAGGGFMLLVILLILVICMRQSHKAERNYRKMQLLLDNLESNVRNECKQAFAELQTDITDLTGDLEGGGIPFWDYHTYTFKVLFPGLSDHVILHPPEIKKCAVGFTEHGLQHLYHLLNNKYFLLVMIRTLEAQKSFSIRDKVNVASLLMVIYQDNMEYSTEILKCLLNELVEKSVLGKHPKLMLRRTESVVEKLLTNWLSLCMYKYLRDLSGSSLYVLYRAMKLHVEKGPVDCLTGDARYTLSEDKLLREKIDPKLLTLHVFYEGEVTHCKVLNCDTITQAKEKIIDVMYRNIPFSNRPWACDLDLEWKKGSVPVTLQDEDSSTQKLEGWKKINTLQHYHVFDGAEMALVRRYQSIKSPNGSLDTSVVSVTSSASMLRMESDSGTKFYHLVKHDDMQTKEGGVKMVPEVFLPRLLATKGTLQKYIDDFFRTILSVNPMMPPVIKYLFDYLDNAALKYGIHDPDVLHTWKCNSLPLRFWVNIIKNPDFVFDIHKPVIVDSCLSVVAQTFMDSCSTSEHRLGKDSPSNKLLFAKDIPHYRKMVDRYFRDIHEMTPISDQDMASYMASVSRAYPGRVYKSSALIELYAYISKYSTELMEVLDQDPVSMRMQLPVKLGTVITAMEGPNSGKLAFV